MALQVGGQGQGQVTGPSLLLSLLLLAQALAITSLKLAKLPL
jgi:hypothetical protein